MVYPIILLDTRKRLLLTNIAYCFHIICFLICLGGFVMNSVVFLLIRPTIIKLLENELMIGSKSILISGILLGLTSILHLWSLVYLKDQTNKHSVWKISSIQDGSMISLLSLLISIFVCGFHGFFWANYDNHFYNGFYNNMIELNDNGYLKSYIHQIQEEYKCCGIDSYKDWVKPVENNIEWKHCQKYSSKSSIKSCYIPHSCCKGDQHFCSPWNLVLEEQFGQGTLSKLMYYQDGCLNNTKSSLKLVYLSLIYGILIILEVISALITRLLSTSYYVYERINPEDDVYIPSWILSIGKINPEILIEHTLKCFSSEKEFDFMTLELTLQEKKERSKQREQTVKSLKQVIEKSRIIINRNDQKPSLELQNPPMN